MENKQYLTTKHLDFSYPQNFPKVIIWGWDYERVDSTVVYKTFSLIHSAIGVIVSDGLTDWIKVKLKQNYAYLTEDDLGEKCTSQIIEKYQDYLCRPISKSIRDFDFYYYRQIHISVSSQISPNRSHTLQYMIRKQNNARI